MDFGMPTLIENKNLEENVALCKRLGLSFIELNMNLPEYQPHILDTEKLNFFRETEGIYFTIHLDENMNIADFNPLITAAYIETVRETAEKAKKAKIPVMNIHFSKGVYFTLPDRKVYLFSEYEDFFMKKILEFREICDVINSDSSIKICIENTGGYADFQKKAIDEYLKSESFGLTLDVGHSYCVNDMDLPFILSHKDKLLHMHLHGATDKSCHLPLGDGTMDADKMLGLAGECNCRVVLETKTVSGLETSVNYINNYRRR